LKKGSLNYHYQEVKPTLSKFFEKLWLATFFRKNLSTLSTAIIVIVSIFIFIIYLILIKQYQLLASGYDIDEVIYTSDFLFDIVFTIFALWIFNSILTIATTVCLKRGLFAVGCARWHSGKESIK
jgi:hypothetical protein